MVATNKALDKAQKFVAKGNLDKAIDEYRKILDAKPGDTSTRLRVGDLYVKVGKDEEAIKEYHQVGRSLTKKGFYLKAIAVFKQILKLDPTNLDIRYRLAELYTKQGLIADAIGEYDILAKHFESRGKREDALNIIKKMIEIDSENVGIRLRLAEIYDQSGFHDDAFEEYRDASSRLIKNGKLDKAEMVLRTLYDKEKKHPTVLEGLIEIAKAKGESDLLQSYTIELATLSEESGTTEAVDLNGALTTEVVDESVDVTLDEESAVEEESVELAEDEAEKEADAIQEEVAPEPLEEHRGEPEGDEELTPWSDMIEIEDDTVPSHDETDEELEVVEEAVDTGLEEPEEEKSGDLDDGGLEEEAIEPIAELTPTDIEDLPELEAEPLEEEIEEVSEYCEVLDAIDDDKTATDEERAATVAETTREEAGAEPELPGDGEVESDDEAEGGEDEALDESGFVDLSSELGLDEEQDGFMWLEGIKGHAEVTEEFKDGVERQLNKEDAETHYNMGVAYMEMEMYEEAIKEFNIAIKDPRWELDCQVRLGMSYMEMGSPREAIACYEGGLAVKGRAESEMKGVMYELALAYEADGQDTKGQEYYKKISKIDSNFRDVKTRVVEVKKTGTKKVEAKKASSPIPTDDEVIEVELI